MKMRKLYICGFALILSAFPAGAGFNSWTAEVEKDPFSGGKQVTVSISTSIRSGVLLLCDTAKEGLRVRAIPGFAYDPRLDDIEPIMEFAIDGVRLFSQAGRTGAVGDNLAVAEATLTGENAVAFINAYASAKKQIAVKDGISDRPHLLTSRGSTKAGDALLGCLNKDN